MKFRPGQGPGKETLRETVVGYEPSWVDFRMEDGTFVRNIISELGNDGDEGLYLTYKFEYHFPELDPQSKEGKEKLAHLKEVSVLPRKSFYPLPALFLLTLRLRWLKMR